MSESMECQFCKKTFTTRNILLQHQKRAKYCLELQGTEQTNFECKYCKKQLSTNERLISHITSSCKEKKNQENIEKEQKVESNFNEQKKYYEDKIKEKNEYIAKLESNIEKLEAKLEKFEDTVTSMVLSKTDKKPTPPNTTTNNTTNIVINNSLNLNDISTMSAFLEEKMDKEVVAGGQKGLAFLLSNTVLKDKYKCVDPSRQNFEFTNELGEVERDVKAKKLTNALIRSDICAKAGERGIQLWKKEDGSTDSLRHDAHSKKVLEMIMFSQDNSTFRSELSALTS